MSLFPQRGGGGGGGGGGGSGTEPTGWTVPLLADFEVVCEGGAGEFKIAGDDGALGLRGVSASRDGQTCDGMALFPLPATLADGKRVAVQIDYLAWGSTFATAAAGIILAADGGGGAWSGPSIYVDAGNATPLIGARVTCSATALSFADVGAFDFNEGVPKFLGFSRDGSSIYFEYSVDGVNWIRTVTAASTPTAALTHLGIWVYNRGAAYSQARIGAFTVQDV